MATNAMNMRKQSNQCKWEEEEEEKPQKKLSDWGLCNKEDE